MKRRNECSIVNPSPCPSSSIAPSLFSFTEMQKPQPFPAPSLHGCEALYEACCLHLQCEILLSQTKTFVCVLLANHRGCMRWDFSVSVSRSIIAS